MLINDLLHVNLLHAYPKVLHNNANEINDDEYIIFKGLNNLIPHLHNMNDSL